MRVRIVRREEVCANFRLDRRQNIAIDEIKEINPEQQRERSSAAGDRTVSGFHYELPIGR